MPIRKRYLVAVTVVFLAAWRRPWGGQEEPYVFSTDAFPSRVREFLDAYNLTEVIDDNLEALGVGNSTRPGLQPDAPAMKHPVVIVPGLTSCGLEVWKAHPCLGDGFFRRRVWGDVSMAQAILSNWSCWLHHVTLDPRTGVDREGVRVRPATGLKSSDYFAGNYWLWARMIVNLADIGYDEADIHLACYDWRLAFPLLEERDGYFTALKHDIEKLFARHKGVKVVVLGHSMGSNVWLYFMNWVEKRHPGWVDKHVDSFVNIAGALLGAMGPLAAFVSGEMDVTAAMGPFAQYVDAFALSFDEMRQLSWSFGSLGGLLPKGGNAVWGSASTGWTDTPSDVLVFNDNISAGSLSGDLDFLYSSVEEKMDELPLAGYPAWTSYFHGSRRPLPDRSDDKAFSNPLASALPDAPNMKIYCMYGTGQPTERAYRYGLRQVRWRWADSAVLPENRIFQWSSGKPIADTIEELRLYMKDKSCQKRPVLLDWRGGVNKNFSSISAAIGGLEGVLADPERTLQDWLRISTGFHSPEEEDPWGNGVDGKFAYGVAKTDGDSTVPLLSLGYMCSHGWRHFKEFNPSGMKVITREFEHLPTSVFVDSRGGPMSAKHVEIIGNTELIANVLSIVGGEAAELDNDRFFSNISRIGDVVTERLRSALAR